VQALVAAQKARALFGAEQSAQWRERKMQTGGGQQGAPMEATPAAELPLGATALIIVEPRPEGAVIYAPSNRSQEHVVGEV
jgi:hypothetical protein